MRNVKIALAAILAVLAPSSYSETTTFGDWALHVPDDRSAVAAITTSDSGTTLGLVCRKDFDGCYWSISSGNACTEDSISVYLINADSGAASVEAICQVADSGNNFVMLTPFDTVEEAVKNSKSMGIAIPLDGGKFRVLRFSLVGSNKAMDAAFKIHEVLRRNIGDEVL